MSRSHFMFLWWRISPRAAPVPTPLPSESARKTIHVLLPQQTNTVGPRTAWDVLRVRHAPRRGSASVRSCFASATTSTAATPHVTFSYTSDVISRPEAISLPFFCVNIESICSSPFDATFVPSALHLSDYTRWHCTS